MADDCERQVQVFLDGAEKLVSGLLETTTCRDLLEALQQSRPASLTDPRVLHLFEEWRGFQRRIGSDELVVGLLEQWGAFDDEVKFVARSLNGDELRLNAFERCRKNARLPKVACGRRRRIHGGSAVDRVLAKARYAPLRHAVRQRLVEMKLEARQRFGERLAVQEEERSLANRLKELQSELEKLQVELAKQRMLLDEEEGDGEEKADSEPAGEHLSGEIERLTQELTVKSKLKAHRHSKLELLNNKISSIDSDLEKDEQKLEELFRKLQLGGGHCSLVANGRRDDTCRDGDRNKLEAALVSDKGHNQATASSLVLADADTRLPASDEDSTSLGSLSSLDSDSNLV